MVALALTGGTSSALAALPPDAPPESYLYIVDAKNIKVKPNEDGSRAKIVLDNVTVTRFSDRPYRHEHYMSVGEMFAEFGSDPKTGKWEDPTPNAGVSIAGHRTEIVDIRRATGDEKRLVLRVRDVRYALKALEGVGAIFIDNVEAVSYPMTQVKSLGSGDTISATLTSATSARIDLCQYQQPCVSKTLTNLQPNGTVTGPSKTPGDEFTGWSFNLSMTFPATSPKTVSIKLSFVQQCQQVVDGEQVVRKPCQPTIVDYHTFTFGI
jgi:hypothetical protein